MFCALSLIATDYSLRFSEQEKDEMKCVEQIDSIYTITDITSMYHRY